MEKKVLITVVIPAFNMESYLPRCLESVLTQTFRELEVLCIDDASTDGTAGILQHYATRDGRIRILSVFPNAGVSHARNLALEEARGEYIYFLDADDWIDPEYLEQMWKHAEQTGQDVTVNGNWYLEYDNPGKRRCCDRFGFVREEPGFYPPVQVQSCFFPVVWARLYRLDYLRKNNITFPMVKSGAEDNYFVSLAEVLQKRSYVFCGPFYHYYQRKGSLSSDRDYLYAHIEVFRRMQEAFRERGIPPAGAKRFHSLEHLRIVNAGQFDAVHSFLASVEEDVLGCPYLYYSKDIFILKAILACPDYRAFRRRFFPSLNLDWRLRVIRNRKWPSVEEVLDGSWKI